VGTYNGPSWTRRAGGLWGWFGLGARVYISILLVRVLLSELRRRGLDDRSILHGTSIDDAVLADMRSTISLSEWAVVLTRAVELSGDPTFGLAMGENFSQSKLQLIGQLISACRTLRQAFVMFERYSRLIGNNIQWSLEEHGEWAYMFCDPSIEHPLATRVAFEAWLGIIHRIGRAFLCTDQDPAAELWFKHPAPDYADQYKRVFQCKVLFSQPRYAIVASRDYLDRVQPLSDDTVRDVLTSSAEILLREREADGVAERVRGLLRFEEDIHAIEVRRVAQHLGLNVRALRRRFSVEGVSLSALLDEARLRIAQRELRKPGVSIKEAAYALGFSEASAFHRAFKRWSGQTPAQYVKELEELSSSAGA
jgi:AraC-like DNA-binding protein